MRRLVLLLAIVAAMVVADRRVPTEWIDRCADAYRAAVGEPPRTGPPPLVVAAPVATVDAGLDPEPALLGPNPDWPELSTEAAPDDEGDEAILDDAPIEGPDEAPEEAAPSEDAEGEPRLVSIASETWIYAEPRWRSRRLGYLRAGAIVEREAEPTHRRHCPRGWYRVQPRGYVCHNEKSSTLDVDHPAARLSQRRPDFSGLPYTYVKSRYPTPPYYVRLPTADQMRKVEGNFAAHVRKHESLRRDPDFVDFPDPDPIPPLLEGGQVLPGLRGRSYGDRAITRGRARPHSGFALLGTYAHEGRRFGLTTELALLPLDRTRMVPPSTLRGVPLSDEFSLPVAIVKSKFARGWTLDPESGALAAGPLVSHRSAFALTGEHMARSGVRYYEATGGTWLRSDKIVRIADKREMPGFATDDKKWIDVSILQQSLVAYEGKKPVFATLVSTGADGLADHEDTHATIQGTFLIHTKHVSVTMDGDEEGDEFDLRDVPYVQYFTEGYALHGAYWHDDFGRPRSHGCVNLAPVDAAWLFGWTDPQVPEGWHAALSLKKGTLVSIHR